MKQAEVGTQASFVSNLPNCVIENGVAAKLTYRAEKKGRIKKANHLVKEVGTGSLTLPRYFTSSKMIIFPNPFFELKAKDMDDFKKD